MSKALGLVGLITFGIGAPWSGALSASPPPVESSAGVAARSVTPVATQVPSGASAVLADLVMVDGVAPGYITADKCSTLVPGPQTRSTANHDVATAVANLSVVPVDTDGRFCVYNQSPVSMLADVQGYFAPPADGGQVFVPSDPSRLLDTRVAPAVRPPAGTITKVTTGLAGTTSAVLVDIAMTDGAGPGYITADKCSVLQPGPQTGSNANYTANTTIANAAVVPVDPDGSFCIYNQLPVHLVVDIQGSFTTDGTQQFFPLAATRVLDTRPPPGTPGPPITSCRSVVHIGDSTSVGLISPSYLANPADRIDAQYRRVGVTNPRMEISGARSIVETLPGQVNAHDVAAGIKAGGYQGCWVLALGTTDTANIAAGAGISRSERIDRMMSVVGDDPVLWVNVKTLETTGAWSNTNMQLWDQALAAARARYPNLHVYDWSSVVDNAWFGGDRIHYTSDGYAIRARLIADALARELPG